MFSTDVGEFAWMCNAKNVACCAFVMSFVVLDKCVCVCLLFNVLQNHDDTALYVLYTIMNTHMSNAKHKEQKDS